MRNGSSGDTLYLGDYLALLRRRWMAVCLCLLLGLGTALAYLQWAPKQYRATTSILITAVDDGTQSAATKNAINLDTEAQLVTSTGTVAGAAQRLRVPSSAEAELVAGVSVSAPANTHILQISYAAATPGDAQRRSLAFAQAYLDQRRQLAADTLQAEENALQTSIDAVNAERQEAIKAEAPLAAGSPAQVQLADRIATLNTQLTKLAGQQNQIRATIVSPGQISVEPSAPSSPSSPNRLVTLTAGLLLGLLAGVGLAMLRQRLDDLIRRPEDLFRRTDVPVTAVLAGRLGGGRVAIEPPATPDGRGYARLRNLVTAGLLPGERPVVVVAGIRHGGGTVAANLAASLARAGEDVFLVCADPDGRTAAGLLGDGPHAGLAEILLGEVGLADAARPVAGLPRLRVLAPGRAADRMAGLQESNGLLELVTELASDAYVVIDAPATSESPDAQRLANTAQLAVVVVEVGQARAREVLDACTQFETVGTPVLGAVIAHYGRDEHPGTHIDAARQTGGSTPGSGDHHAAPGASGGPDEAEGAIVAPRTQGAALVPPGSRGSVSR